MNENKERGQLHISNDIFAELAAVAALGSYGVIGMANPNLVAGAVRLLHPSKLKKGVRVIKDDNGIKIELYVALEYGTNLNEVARNLNDRVKYEIDKHTGIKVSSVEIYIQDIKVK